MQIFKSGFIAVFMCAFLTMTSFEAMAMERAEIAAVVNDDIITTTDIQTRLRLNTGGRSIPQAEKKIAYDTVLDELINETLQRQEAKTLSIQVEDQQIRDAFSRIARENGLTVQQFRDRLKGIGVPVEAFYDKIETDIAWSQVVRRKLRPQVSISENDIDAIFDDIERTEGKTQYRVAEIFVASKGAFSGGNDDSKSKIDGLLKQIVNGGSFPDIARRHSEAPGASRGGDLGWLTLEQMDEAFRPHVLNMKAGQVSQPIQSNRGYHILLLIERKEPQSQAPQKQAVKTPVDVSKVRLQQIFIPVSEGEPTEVRGAKMARAAALQKEIQGCEAMRSKFDDFDSQLTGDLGYVDLSDLPETIGSVVKDLPSGALSKPMVNPQGIFVLMVCDRQTETVVETAPETLNAEARENEAAREQIANQLGSRKLEGLQQRYLRDLRAAAFVDLRL